jgi:hypothetical protein
METRIGVSMRSRVADARLSRAPDRADAEN